eukprot:3334370-Pleurochrysis_carterae.AAC.1
MDSLLLKGLSEASLTEFNALPHAFTRLNRSLPAHARLGDPLVSEKLCAVVRRLSESINTILDVKLVVKGATGDLALTLTTIREPQGRAFVAKQLGSKPEPPSTPQSRKDSKRGDPARNTPGKKSKAQQGQWTNRYMKCRHCGGTHWHRECPKRQKAKSDNDQKSAGRAAAVSSSVIADEKLDAAIGNVLLAADSQPRSVEIGAALCVRDVASSTAAPVPLSPKELKEQDERELALVECRAELAGAPLHSENERSSDDSNDPPSPQRDDKFFSYERAGGFWHDQSVYGEPGYDVAIPKPFTYPGDANNPIVHKRDKLVPFVNIWPDLDFCDCETWREAVDIHNAKNANRRAKREA